MAARFLVIAVASLLPVLCTASEDAEIKAVMEQARHPKGDFKAALAYRMAGLNILGERLNRALGTCTYRSENPSVIRHRGVHISVWQG